MSLKVLFVLISAFPILITRFMLAFDQHDFGLCGGLWPHFEAFVPVLGPFGPVLGPFGPVLGAFDPILGPLVRFCGL